MRPTVSSPNDWLTKIGCKVTELGQLSLPKDVALPMHFASEEVEAFNKEENFGKKYKQVQLIALNTRSADTAFFRQIVEQINGKIGKEVICHNCLRKAVNPSLVIFRRETNEKILHKMDRGQLSTINPSDFQIALDYYDEVLKLPLLEPTKIGNVKMEPCEKCKKRAA